MSDVTAPQSTYRLQFGPGCGFDDAASLADYLSSLGVSHLYASPYLQATPGSTHGYDVVRPGRVNVDLGGASGHERMVKALRAAGLGQVLDIVPNHMAIPGRSNPWWWSVLRDGRASPYADYFDLDWDALAHHQLLLPVLGDHFGRVLDAGELQLRRAISDEAELEAETHDGLSELVIGYYDAEFPLDPTTLAQAGVDVSMDDQSLAGFNEDRDRLALLIEAQHYRLAHWRVAGESLDYRRFFDINALVGVRVERPEVFAATHSLVGEWLRSGVLDGVRVDHIDGLRDPSQYLRNLRVLGSVDTWIVVEKILEAEERLPASWPVAGTTGYDALNRIDGLFVDPEGVPTLLALHADFTGERRPWSEIVTAAKWHVVNEVLGSDVERLTDSLVQLCWQHRRQRDHTRSDLHAAVAAFLVAFPQYRTYVADNQKTTADSRVLSDVRRSVLEAHPEIAVDLVEFLFGVLTLAITGAAETEWAMSFQQVTGPVMAKSLEDTAFYRYFPLAARNEVGGDPGRLDVSPANFHEACAEAQRSWPTAMVATTTHDTKRSEDVRWRLLLLSEVPAEWAEAVKRWSRIAERHRRPMDPEGRGFSDGRSDSRWPDRSIEYLLWQTLVGAWPLSAERAVEYLRKASKEAKVHTSWTTPDPFYDEALVAYVEGVTNDRELQDDVALFVAGLVEAGRRTSLAATALKLTMPGVPDIYQGTESWDLSLVDPDNRRPVDWAQRRAIVDDLERGLPVDDVVARSDEGVPKVHLVRSLLHLRNRRPECFGAGAGYEPLVVSGPQAHHVVGFVRGQEVAVIVPRLVLGLDQAGGWQGTTVEFGPGRWVDVLTGDARGGGSLLVSELLGRFPLAVLERKADA